MNVEPRSESLGWTSPAIVAAGADLHEGGPAAAVTSLTEWKTRPIRAFS